MVIYIRAFLLYLLILHERGSSRIDPLSLRLIWLVKIFHTQSIFPPKHDRTDRTRSIRPKTTDCNSVRRRHLQKKNASAALLHLFVVARPCSSTTRLYLSAGAALLRPRLGLLVPWGSDFASRLSSAFGARGTRDDSIPVLSEGRFAGQADGPGLASSTKQNFLRGFYSGLLTDFTLHRTTTLFCYSWFYHQYKLIWAFGSTKMDGSQQFERTVKDLIYYIPHKSDLPIPVCAFKKI